MKKEFLINNLDTGLSYEVNLKNEVIKKISHIKRMAIILWLFCKN